MTEDDVLKQAGVTKDSAGNVVYRGQTFPGFGKPIRDSGGKQGKVLVRRGDKIRIVRFGDPSLRDNTSTEANDRFYARFGGQSGLDDPFSALYWSARWLWPRGSQKGKGPKEFFTIKKSAMDIEGILKQESFAEFSADLTEAEDRICRRVMMEALDAGMSTGQAMAICAATIRGMRDNGGSDSGTVERSVSNVNKNSINDKMERYRIAVDGQLGDNYYFVDADDDYIFARQYGMESGGSQLMRYSYTFEGNEFIIDTASGERTAFETFSIGLGEGQPQVELVERSVANNTTSVSKQATATRGGQTLTASDFAYTPDRESPSTWKLRIDTASRTSAAVAALGAGFRGNRVQIPSEDRPAVIRRVRAAYRRFFPDNELPDVIKSTAKEQLIELIDKAFGAPQGSGDVAVPVIKQFTEEKMEAIEPLYCLADTADAHKEGMTEQHIRKMVDNFNTNISNVKGNIAHIAMTDGFHPLKAWVNECDCMIGDEFVPEGQPIVKMKFTNEKMWEARKSGVLGGVSIGAKGKRIPNPEYVGEDNE